MGQRAVVYARISQDRGGERVGVDRQLKDCLKHAKDKGYVLAHEPFVDNNVSAYSGKPRPEYKKMAQLVESDGVGVIVVWHIDRLYRSPRELEDLIDLIEGKGMIVDPVTADSTINLSNSDGILVARIGVAVARKSSDDTRRRVKSAKTEGRENGRWSGGGRTPYGYDLVASGADPRTGAPRDIQLVINETQAAIVREAARRVIDGEVVNRIAVDLNTRGVKTAGGLRWRPAHVRRLLISPMHAGIVAHEGAEMGPGSWPAILTADEHRILVARLASKQATGERLGARKNVLSGLVRCKVCGSKVYGDGWGMYRCSARDGGCGKISVSASRLEEYVHNATLLHGEKVARRAVDDSQGRGPEPDDEAILGQMAALEGEIDAIAASLGDGLLSLRLAESASARIGARLEELRVKLSTPRTSTQAPTKNEYVALTFALLDRWEKCELTAADVAKLNATFEGYIRQIKIGPGPRGSNLDDRVEIEWAS